MARTFIRQDTQIRKSSTYDDTVTPSQANYETNPTNIEDDLNCLRSQVQNIINRNGASFPAGDWYSDMTAPITFENGAKRGVDSLNSGLHNLERKRVLVTALNLTDVAVPAAQNWVVLALGELPSNTTAAIGPVTTLGTVCAYNATFGAHSLDEVSGATAISPKNMCVVVDATTRDPIMSGGRDVFALFQSESNTDASTLSGTTPNRAQLSFVRINSTGDDLEAVPAADIQGKSINYSSVNRKALQDLTEQDFLKGAEIDVPSSSTITRQIAYDNQGTTPVELTTNAQLDLNSAGIYWEIRDLANASLLRITEGSTGGTTVLQIASDVDTFDVNATTNDFNAGVTIRSGGTRPIVAGVTDGVLATTAGDLMVRGFSQLAFSDQWQAGSTYGTDLVLADSSAEWDQFETDFGEVSILNALHKAYTHGSRGSKVYANVTATITAGNDVGGVGGGTNLDAQLPDMSGGTFITDYDVYVNGELMRPAAGAGVNDYYPGTSLVNGQLRFDFALRINDVICVVPYVA